MSNINPNDTIVSSTTDLLTGILKSNYDLKQEKAEALSEKHDLTKESK